MRWEQPMEVSDLDIAFGGRARELTPPREECEAAIAAMEPESCEKWKELQARWFFEGLGGLFAVKAKPGVDPALAMRHLGAIQQSFEPKHEHKLAAVAYLASLWFEDYSFDGFEAAKARMERGVA